MRRKSRTSALVMACVHPFFMGGFDPVQTCLDMLTLADGLDLVPDVRGLSYVERIPRLIGGRESQAARWRMDSRRRVLAGFRHRPAI